MPIIAAEPGRFKVYTTEEENGNFSVSRILPVIGWKVSEDGDFVRPIVHLSDEVFNFEKKCAIVDTQPDDSWPVTGFYGTGYASISNWLESLVEYHKKDKEADIAHAERLLKSTEIVGSDA